MLQSSCFEHTVLALEKKREGGGGGEGVDHKFLREADAQVFTG